MTTLIRTLNFVNYILKIFEDQIKSGKTYDKMVFTAPYTLVDFDSFHTLVSELDVYRRDIKDCLMRIFSIAVDVQKIYKERIVKTNSKEPYKTLFFCSIQEPWKVSERFISTIKWDEVQKKLPPNILPQQITNYQLNEFCNMMTTHLYPIVCPDAPLVDWLQSIRETRPETNCTLEDFFKDHEEYLQIMRSLVEAGICQAESYFLIDSKPGRKSLVVAIIKNVHSKGYLTRLPKNYEIMSIAKNTFGIIIKERISKNTAISFQGIPNFPKSKTI